MGCSQDFQPDTGPFLASSPPLSAAMLSAGDGQEHARKRDPSVDERHLQDVASGDKGNGGGQEEYGDKTDELDRVVEVRAPALEGTGSLRRGRAVAPRRSNGTPPPKASGALRGPGPRTTLSRLVRLVSVFLLSASGSPLSPGRVHPPADDNSING